MRRSNGYSGQCMFLSSRVCCLNNFVASVPVMVLRNNKKISMKTSLCGYRGAWNATVICLNCYGAIR